ncbi:MAG: peroxidase family protein, partial [Bacteroidota bacterium]
YLTYKHLFVFLFLGVLSQEIQAQAERLIDGFGNNLSNPHWGAVGDVQPRISPADYADGISEPKLDIQDGKENPRIISNILFAQDGIIQSDLSLSDYTWVFGQFVDHDIILSENGHEALNNIVVPDNDEHFIPGTVIRMSRSEAAEGTGTSIENPREHQNRITAFLDLSQVYGSDEHCANWLRTKANGKLKVSARDMLPWNTVDGEFNSNVDVNAPLMADDTHTLTKMYVAGDIRANENPLLIAFHTLFVREHNKLCDQVKDKHPGWDDERIYQAARKRLIAYYQRIVYNEWLPALGVGLPPYNGYNPTVNPQILNEFSTAAFRMGHTLINGTIIRMDNNGREIKGGNISLKDAFFNPFVVEFAGGIDAYFKGMATQVQQEFDCKVIDDVRNFLFGAPGAGGLDLAAININRGRERGITDYNTLRVYLGMPRLSSFDELTDNSEEAELMESVFGDIDNVDAWVGMLAEPHLDGVLFGNLVATLMERQFQALREGDRFYFENMDFSQEEMDEIFSISMRDILMRNTSIDIMQDNVFKAIPHESIEGGPSLIPFPLEAVIYPNPVIESMQIKVYGSREESVTVSVVDYAGRMVNKTTHDIYEGNNTVIVDLQDCPRGHYNVILDTEYRRNVLKMIKR